MPVLGHAVVGWVTAREIAPNLTPGVSGGRAYTLWAPTLVALAYAPDIAAQGGLLLGWGLAPRAAHSLVLAVLAAPLAGLALAHGLGVGRLRALAVSFGSVALHDVLDLLQTPERQPFWPLSTWHLGDDAAIIPTSGPMEALVFLTALGLYLLADRLLRHDGRRRTPTRRPLTVALIATLMAAAGTTHYLRATREAQLRHARLFVRQGRFPEALQAAAEADRWPSTAHPGRIDQVRAEAHEGLGELDRAIAAYSRAVDADPTNFWAVAGLAAACALRPSSERAAVASSLRGRLLRDFSTHPALAAAVARIDRRLARNGFASTPDPPTRPAPRRP